MQPTESLAGRKASKFSIALNASRRLMRELVPGLVPRIHVFTAAKAWAAGPSPAMTTSTQKPSKAKFVLALSTCCAKLIEAQLRAEGRHGRPVDRHQGRGACGDRAGAVLRHDARRHGRGC